VNSRFAARRLHGFHVYVSEARGGTKRSVFWTNRHRFLAYHFSCTHMCTWVALCVSYIDKHRTREWLLLLIAKGQRNTSEIYHRFSRIYLVSLARFLILMVDVPLTVSLSQRNSETSKAKEYNLFFFFRFADTAIMYVSRDCASKEGTGPMFSVVTVLG